MEKYKAVIFDMDGTLLDTLEDITDSVNYALGSLGFAQRDLSEIRSYVGNGVIRMMELSFPDGTQNPLFNDAVSLFKRHYAKNCRNKTRPYDGIMELLELLIERGYKTAVISNKYDTAVKELNQFYFSDYIPIAIGESSDIKRKPAADMLLAALNRLSVPGEEAIYIGDSEVDIETAKNAGVDCISVAWGFRDRDWLVSHGAKTIVDSPEELAALL
ncbi:MAG: HAD-IA family hydrolase [Dehalococcoidales bacterium]|nr:HAD-IA family hydrolase [Dehalococcoidales bacterium]